MRQSSASLCRCQLEQNEAKHCEILKDQGFIESYLVKQDDSKRGTIRLFLKYTDGRYPVIQGLAKEFPNLVCANMLVTKISRVFTAVLGFRLCRLLKGSCLAMKQRPGDWRRTFVFGLVKIEEKATCLVKVNFPYPFQKG